MVFIKAVESKLGWHMTLEFYGFLMDRVHLTVTAEFVLPSW